MKLSKIYSNNKNIFEEIEFHNGLNIIIGEIRNPENLNSDTHNLGKSKLCELIDFCLLRKRTKDFFLFKNEDIFKDFIFYLEVELNSGEFVTIRRSVATPSKINIIKHKQRSQDFNSKPITDWPHYNIAFEKAKTLLDGLFNLDSINHWDYRTALGYALRDQNDYVDVFRLKDFIGRHIYWKPYIGHLLGFNADNLIKNYKLGYEIEDYNKELEELIGNIDRLLGDEEELLTDLLTIKRNEILEIQNQLKSFDFDSFDIKNVESLASEIEIEISELNKIRYYLNITISRLHASQFKDEPKFHLDEVEKLFKDVKIHFGDSLKKTYEELVDFNTKITTERFSYAREQIRENETTLNEVSIKLRELNALRSKKIEYLNSTNTFDKYKEVSNHLQELNNEINNLEKRLENSLKVKSIKEAILNKQKEKNLVIEYIKQDRDTVVKSETGIYCGIKSSFTHFVKAVLDKNGAITTEQNNEGNLDYWAGIVAANGKKTSESDGHSYQKILCMGYDVAILITYSNRNFLKFVYHDGGLETLDDRKKIAFLNYVSLYSNLMGFQYILTLIDTDLPKNYQLPEGSIVKLLHDDGYDGLLFKMKVW